MIQSKKITGLLKSRVYTLLALLLLLCGGNAFADYKLPEQQNPPRLVNDYAHVLSAGDVQQLEQKLRDYDAKTSTQISIVTIPTLDGYDISDYGLALFNKWGIGQASKKNGVLLLASIQDRKVTIRVGKGLEGALTDAKSGVIIRNEIVPAFRDQRYAQGFSDAADAIIATTRGEYSADDGGHVKHKKIPGAAIILAIVFIIFIIKMMGGGGGGGGRGRYLSRRGGGVGDFATGWLIGSLLSGGNRGSGWGGGGGGWGGGGGSDWGGFGGGSSGGGGASGSW